MVTISKSDLAELAKLISETSIVYGGQESKVIRGKNTKLLNAILNVSSGTITIGDDTFFGHNVSILTGSHFLTGNRKDYHKEGRDIVIGNNVWIASNVTVLGPCTIGDDAVIAAGSVVTKDVEGGWVYAGVPARKLKKVEM